MPEKQSHAFGWKRDLPDQRDYCFTPKAPVTQLPTSVDLRPDFSRLAVYDQGNLGSCTANSVAAALWYQQGIQRNEMSGIEASRLFIYYNERMIEHTTRQDSGASIRDSMKSVATYGACSETEWPYTIAKFKNKPPKAQYESAKVEVLAKTYRAVGQDLNALQSAIYEKKPVCIGISVYQSFESEVVARTGFVPMPKKTEGLLGGHAVLIVGYDNNHSRFILRNSWGSDWGDKGYFYLPYAYVLNPNLAADFWIIESV